MDLTFSSANSQNLTLTSCTQLSNFSATKPIRTQFLGSGHRLRPPDIGPLRLRYRSGKCRKFGMKTGQTRRFVVNASLNSGTVLVVVAVTTLSALSFAYLREHYLNKNNKRSKKSSTEVLSFGKLEVMQLGRYIVKNVIDGWFLDGQNVQSGSDVVENKELEAKAKESSSAFEEKESQNIFPETALMSDSVLVKMADSPDAAFLACNTFGYVVPAESQTTLPLLPSTFSEAGTVLPLMFATEMSELTLEKTRKETEVDAASQEVIVKTRPSEPAEKEGHPPYNGIVEESDREDLYTFFQSKNSMDKIPLKVNGFKAVGPHAPTQNGEIATSLKVNSILKEVELSGQPPLKVSGSSSHKNKNFRRSRCHSKDKERRNVVQNSHAELTHHLPQQSGIHANDGDHLQEKVKAYNILLRDGRLSDCVDILEDMEKRDMLDMNKVYHAKFFSMCKMKKAVQEAFRFCKLIPNPTLSTFNMLMSVCASSRDSEGAFQVLKLAHEAGLKADCKLYTTLISTCAKSGKVDAMFEVYHEMVNAGVEPNVRTYGALIDGCARAGQVAKAFGAYGILRLKKVKPDRVVFNALITACGQAGAVDRAFDVLAEMGDEARPIDPDHITIGALMKACANANQVDRAKEVYNMIHKYNIKGTPEVYTIAINSCSKNGDWEFACSVYDDMTRNGVEPDEMFLSAMIDVAGHAGMLDAAFDVLQNARTRGIQLGIMPYSSLMGACSNAKNWQKALELYEDIKSIKLKPTVATLNALITALCDGDKLPKAIEVLSEMKSFGLCPNTITYSILLVASERKDDIEVALMLLSEAKKDGTGPTLLMCKCIIGMCMRRFEKACTLGEPVVSLKSGQPQIENEWTSLALMVYRETIAAGVVPTVELVSQILGCLRLPRNASLKARLVENLGVTAGSPRLSNLCSLLDGFGEYDPRAFSVIEEAASLGIFPLVSFKQSPIVIDAKTLYIHTAEVYLLTILRGLKHRLAAGATLPNVNILLPIEKAQIKSSKGESTINIAGRVGQSIASLLRRLGLPYQGNESYGKIRINGISLKRWLQPKLEFPFSGKPEQFNLSQLRIGKEISHQQRSIRAGNFSFD